MYTIMSFDTMQKVKVLQNFKLRKLQMLPESYGGIDFEWPTHDQFKEMYKGIPIKLEHIEIWKPKNCSYVGGIRVTLSNYK